VQRKYKRRRGPVLDKSEGRSRGPICRTLGLEIKTGEVNRVQKNRCTGWGGDRGEPEHIRVSCWDSLKPSNYDELSRIKIQNRGDITKVGALVPQISVRQTASLSGESGKEKVT